MKLILHFLEPYYSRRLLQDLYKNKKAGSIRKEPAF